MGSRPRPRLTTREITNSTRKMKKRILAISMAGTAMEVKPNTAASRATTRNSKASRNMVKSPEKTGAWVRVPRRHTKESGDGTDSYEWNGNASLMPGVETLVPGSVPLADRLTRQGQ